ncbi:hypothetical protein DVH24_005960 [Malus domestica]|uniref:Pentatricopeptide repeat-containing protein n=1 Tax=Malus domestica TaxID=3750 RepID=A0A498INU6_MALDO|nr:hypothetical protein DVH24_005960 [Malus domestica]
MWRMLSVCSTNASKASSAFRCPFHSKFWVSLPRIRPNVYTLNIIIHYFCHMHQMGFSLSILGEFFKLGFEPDVTTFNTLINNFLLEDKEAEAAALFNKWGEAVELLEEMEGKKLDFGIVIYNILIEVSTNNSPARNKGNNEEIPLFLKLSRWQ